MQNISLTSPSHLYWNLWKLSFFAMIHSHMPFRLQSITLTWADTHTLILNKNRFGKLKALFPIWKPAMNSNYSPSHMFSWLLLCGGESHSVKRDLHQSQTGQNFVHLASKLRPDVYCFLRQELEAEVFLMAARPQGALWNTTNIWQRNWIPLIYLIGFPLEKKYCCKPLYVDI